MVRSLVASYSASNPVTSPLIRVLGLPPGGVILTVTVDPMLTWSWLMTSRAGSWKVMANISGRCWWWSTTTCSSSDPTAPESADPSISTSGQRWWGWGILVSFADLRRLVGARKKDAVALRQPQRVIDVIEDRHASPEVRVPIFLVGDRLQRVPIRDEMRSSCVDRARSGVLGAVRIGDLLQADVGGGPQRVPGSPEHRVLDVDLLEVELPVGELAVAAPEEKECRGLMLLATHRHPARRAPGEQLVHLLGHVTDRGLPVIEKDLHADGLRLAAEILGLCPRLLFHVSGRGLPLGAFRHGVLRRIEREFQASRPIGRLQLCANHLRHLFLSAQESVVGEFQRFRCNLVGADVE